ncbi:hypothetical protein GCM10010840_14670 [Deinococcus aerolatus]|uniref:Uncharacterized protein n=1 Tax=Deinococcus aerolatus TaxID=522487 RepID=A0ABQ2G6C0_9DEIO|nr:hypothetical protein GCM10010840_14670 [Deinococcus aerolatus]
MAFFTVVGSQDPQVRPGGEQGPALDLLDALLASGEAVSEVLLAWTPGAQNAAWPGGYDAQRTALEQAVRDRVPGVRVSAVPVQVTPNVASEVLPVFARALGRFRHAGQARVNVSSGTPQMLEAMKVLRGSGWFGAGDVRLYQVDRPTYRAPDRPHWREATLPFLEEVLRLEGAFGALRRFDFAGARTAFAALAAGPLELPGRQAVAGVLEAVADALWWMDARDAAAAGEALSALGMQVPPLHALKSFIQQAGHAPAEVLIWLTWGRYNRAAAQERTADALVWAVALHELLVVKLAEQAGLPDTERPLTAGDLGAGLFDRLKADLAPELLNAQGRLRFLSLRDKLAVLRAPTLGLENVDVFDAGDRRTAPNPPLAQVREWRNLTLHQGRVPGEVDRAAVDGVVRQLLGAYPWKQPWARAWAAHPDACPVSAAGLAQLADDLHGWVA